MTNAPPSSATPRPPSRLSGVWTCAWPWVVGFLPGILLLVLLLPARVTVPWHDGWAFVKQYELWVQGTYDWRQLFAPNFGHPGAVAKVIYFAVLHWLHADFRVFTDLSWIESAIVAVFAGLLSRPLWAGRPRTGALLMLCANLCIFSPALGHSWIWDIVFQNFIPGLCLVAGLYVFSAPWNLSLRLWTASLLSIVSTFSYGGGILVGMVLTPALWQAMRDRSRKERWLAIAVWVAGNAIVSWIAVKGLVRPGDDMEAPEVPIGLSTFSDRPWMRLQFILILLGQTLGKGTVIPAELLCAIIGAVLVLIFGLGLSVVVTQGAKNSALIAGSVPWIVCALFGLVNAILICAMRMTNTFLYSLLPRYGILTLFFVFGTIMLAVAVCRHGDASSRVIRSFRRSSAVALGVYFVLQMCSWTYGWQYLNVQRLRMEQERALLGFATIIPLTPDRLWNDRNNNSTFKVAKILADRGQLQSVTFAADNRIASLKPLSAVNPKFAAFKSAVRLDDGRWQFSGFCRLTKDDASLPDLVLLTAQTRGDEERIVGLAVPVTPDDFFDGQANKRTYPEHYFGWSANLATDALPKGATTFRAYAYLQAKRQVRPIEGTHEIEIPER